MNGGARRSSRHAYLASEKTATVDGSGYLSALDKLAARVADGGQGVEIRVAVSPLASGAAEVIDVTPER